MRLSPRVLVACWDLVRRAGVDLFRPGAAEKVGTIAGWRSAGGPLKLEDGELTLLDALRAFALWVRNEPAPDARSELVVTLPITDRACISTPDAVRMMIDSATKTIHVIGFRMSETNMCRALQRRGCEGIAVTVVGDRADGGAREILKDWPAIARPLVALENVESATPTGHLHAKAIVIDSTVALVGSANFSRSGMNTNFEFGVRVSGNVARSIIRIIDRLVQDGWFVPIRL